MAANIGTELRRLLKKLGGTPSKYDQTNELIHKITDQVESGGGGGNTFIAHITYSAGDGFVMDEALDDLMSAVLAGKNAVAKVDFGTYAEYYPVSYVDYEGAYVDFLAIQDVNASGVDGYIVEVTESSVRRSPIHYG